MHKKDRIDRLLLLAGSNPDKLYELRTLMEEAHVPSPDFPLLKEEFQ